MIAISLATAMALTERSKRTLWRLLAEGAIKRSNDSSDGKAMLDLDSIKPYLIAPIQAKDFALIEKADASMRAGGGIRRKGKD